MRDSLVVRGGRRRKWFVGLLVLALIGAGCGTDADDDDDVAAEDPTTDAEDGEWSLEAAAAPYEGVTINAPFLDRPGYAAAAELIPEFEERTGITVNYDTNPYENTREIQVLDITGGTGEYDLVLVDVVWIGEFAGNDWLVPLEEFYDDPELADPDLNLDGFFPILLDSFGTWDETIYGLPFDNYSGVLYYNECMLEEAGFDAPPETWQELHEDYAPELTGGGDYGFALQSRRGETQSADSFMRVIKAWGADLVDDETFEPALTEPDAIEALEFRQDLMDYMPPDVVEWDHDETVQGFAQGRVAMITEWTSFYPNLADPGTSAVVDCLGVTTEPEGPGGLSPALGGFSLGVNPQSDEDQQAAAWLFIQWITSEQMAEDYVRAGGVSGRESVYEIEELREENPYFEAVVESWQVADPAFRPRFSEWPELSEVIAQVGSQIMLEQVTVEDGAARIENEMERILQPYLAGEKEPQQ
jgi:multiple sugar transport system substrate-binding protein